MKTSMRFLSDEAGAVSIDWVVLTSTTLLLVLLGSVFLKDPVTNLAGDIGAWMAGFHNTLNNQ